MPGFHDIPAQGPSSLDEADLVRRSMEGDGSAFGLLVRPHLPAMVRLAARVTGNSSLAWDVVQESLSKLLVRLHRYSPGTRFQAYFAEFVIRTGRAMLRSEGRRRSREQQAPGAGVAASPEELGQAAELAVVVKQTLAAMPPKRREAVAMRMDLNLEYAEIASALGTSEESVRVLVHLGLKELKRQVALYQASGDVDASLSVVLEGR